MMKQGHGPGKYHIPKHFLEDEIHERCPCLNYSDVYYMLSAAGVK
jgi:hypothetical protein